MNSNLMNSNLLLLMNSNLMNHYCILGIELELDCNWGYVGNHQMQMALFSVESELIKMSRAWNKEKV